MKSQIEYGGAAVYFDTELKRCFAGKCKSRINRGSLIFICAWCIGNLRHKLIDAGYKLSDGMCEKCGQSFR